MSEKDSNWQASDAELLATLRTMQRDMNLLFARMLPVIAEVETRNLAVAAGYGSTVELVRAVQNLPRAQARARVDAAQDLVTEVSPTGAQIPPRLPHTATALTDGAVSEQHVTVIRQALRQLPPHATHHIDDVERDLAAHARRFDTSQLRTLSTRLLAILDQDGRPPKDDTAAACRLNLRDQDGGTAFNGWVDAEGSAIIKAALSPLAAPRPAHDGTPDPRSTERRQGEALVELARRMLELGELPVEGGQRPQVVVTVPLIVLEQRLAGATLDPDLPIGPETARRLACDAQVIPAVLGARSEVLDIGRRSRNIPPAVRRAVVLRDGGCAFPGCPIPAAWSECHHVQHWADGGSTALNNLVLLCGAHHRLVHHSAWEIHITDNLPEFHPPPWLGDQPIRNPMHDKATAIYRGARGSGP